MNQDLLDKIHIAHKTITFLIENLLDKSLEMLF